MASAEADCADHSNSMQRRDVKALSPSPSIFDVNGCVAVVTGGASGIGRSIAHMFATAGVDVGIIDTNESAAEQTLALLREVGAACLFERCDVSSEVEVHRAVSRICSTFGRLDIAVNCAGIHIPGRELSQTREEWNRVIDINLTGVWLCAREEFKMMRDNAHGGKIINIASAAARTVSDNGSYASSKAAVAHLTKVLAVEFGGYNVNVNSVSPGIIITPILPDTSDKFLARIREITPMGYVGRPEDLLGAVMFLASPASNYVTGHDLLVDGGRTLSTWIEPPLRAKLPRISPDQEKVGIST